MRIAIVEDDRELNTALTMLLKQEGFAVDSFTDGDKAERAFLINHSNYDLIVLDYMLPGKTGFEICTHLRAQEVFTPILMLTGIADIENKVSVLDAGADDYVIKPIATEELTARIRALLRRPKSALPGEIKLRGLTFHTSNKQVFFNGKEIKLTLKECNILEYLLRNAGQVVSRDQILDHVWDFAANAFSNIVDVHITNVRKKLEKAGATGILETVRGVGFTIRQS
ncbi:MAG: winged helix family two component transcriptional regulator [Candidatus Paceibacter sp.]|jgi:DNA-binding response OmpR family regulator|nr:winged helix family two component transcriptional regulator [Candidatus Paceibacter sp.]